MVYAIQDGIQELLRMDIPTDPKPIFIAVHSPPAGRCVGGISSDHGKSHFIDTAITGLMVAGRKAGFTEYHDTPQGYIPFHLIGKDYYFLHIAGGSMNGEKADRSCQKHMGRDCDVHILVYNPSMLTGDISDLLDKFDIVLENPKSFIK